MVSRWSALYLFGLLLISAPVQAADCKQALAMIRALPEPTIPDVFYREFSLEAQIVSDGSIAELEKRFWASASIGDSYDALAGKQVSFAAVDALSAEEPGIVSFRIRNGMVSEYFVSHYVAAGPARERLRELLPHSASLGTGYIDYLSETYGDQFFAFPCAFGEDTDDGSVMVVSVGHVYN